MPEVQVVSVAEVAELRREKMDAELAMQRASGEADLVRKQAQNFFAQLASDTRRPWFGDAQRETYRSLLVRAQEAGLYTPESA